MLIGAMNHPQHDVEREISWMAEVGLDFIDLSLEPPAALSSLIDVRKLQRALRAAKLRVVGHTAYYLPIASPFEKIRQAAVGELKQCLGKFARLDCQWMNVHPDAHAPMHDRAFFIERNLESLDALITHGRRVGTQVMIENLPGSFNTVAQLGQLLDPLPELGLHLDIGHCNLRVESNTTGAILSRYAERLKHVHLHDNKGGAADLHLPLGTGTMDVAAQLRALKRAGYDDTITLEVFSADRNYFTYSRDVLRRMWDEAA